MHLLHIGFRDSASDEGTIVTGDRDAATPEKWGGSWDDLRREYEDSKATIKGLRVETEEEGKERAKRLGRRRPTVRVSRSRTWCGLLAGHRKRRSSSIWKLLSVGSLKWPREAGPF